MAMNLLKLGGNQLNDPSFLENFAITMAATQTPVAIIHGGGKAIDTLQQRLGIEPEYVNGLRVTNKETLAAAEMVLCGQINKRIVAALLTSGVDALGLSGVDRGLLRCRKKIHATAELGYVGEIVEIRAHIIRELLLDGITPVIAPISLGNDGKRYNVNADDVASALAVALPAQQLFFLSNVPGVMQDGVVLDRVTPKVATTLIENGIVHTGMVPKLHAAVSAIENGVNEVHIVDLAGLQSRSGTTIAPENDRSPTLTPRTETSDVISDESKFIVPTYSRPPHVFSRGSGPFLYTSDGDRYLDFSSGIAVTALGHSDPEWVSAVTQQAAQLTHVSNLYHTAPHVSLAQKLVENSFATRVFFCNSGSEANEAAIKFARKWARSITGSNEKTTVVAFDGGFHGRTAAALAATARPEYQKPFEPLMPDVIFSKFNDLGAASASINQDTCAVIIEPIQGEGGIRPAEARFLQGLRKLCNQHQALLIFDEVQCGLGRTGALWAHQASEVTPDIMTLAKPLAGGLPIGATLVTETVASTLVPGDHGSTFAAGPLVCRAAQVVFDRVAEPDFLESVRIKGEYMRNQLTSIDNDGLVSVRGRGLLIGAEFPFSVKPVIAAASDRKLLVISAGENVLRLCPPLIVNTDQIDSAINIIADCLSELNLGGPKQI